MGYYPGFCLGTPGNSLNASDMIVNALPKTGTGHFQNTSRQHYRYTSLYDRNVVEVIKDFCHVLLPAIK
jgi:hypothetical protein